MNSRIPWLALALVFGACGGGLWSVGLPDDGPTAQSVVPNGIVLSTGPAAWQEAAQRTTVAWDERLPDGLVFDSSHDVGDLGGGLALLTGTLPHWSGATVRPGHVSLSVDPAGLTLDVDVSLDPVVVTLEVDEQVACLAEVSIPAGRLAGTLTLTKSKLGVVNLSPVGHAAFRAEDATVVLSECDEALLAASGEPEGPEALALSALAKAAFDGLTPSVAVSLPACLGLDLAGATTVAYEDDGLGAGWQHTVIRAPLVSPTPWWQFASGRLVVPYSVGVTADHHGCVPAEPLPVAMSASVPLVDSDWAMLINQQVIARQVAATWAAGGLCGDRVWSGLSWSAEAWTGDWPALDGMASDMAISARVWPESVPEVAFLSGGSGSLVQADVDAGTWSIELMGWRDGARVRLATLHASVVVRAQVVIEASGELWLSADTVDVTVFDSEAGLVSPPGQGGAELHVETVVRGALEALPLWVVPAIPTGATPTVELHGSYLVIRDV